MGGCTGSVEILGFNVLNVDLGWRSAQRAARCVCSVSSALKTGNMGSMRWLTCMLPTRTTEYEPASSERCPCPFVPETTLAWLAMLSTVACVGA